MIAPQELRIGNWYQVDGKPLQFKDYLTIDMESKHVCGFRFERLEGIPLTPEILEKCGFAKTGEREWVNGSVELLSRAPHFKDGFLLLNGEGATHWSCTYFYLHQLQNVYFALINEELNIKRI